MYSAWSRRGFLRSGAVLGAGWHVVGGAHAAQTAGPGAGHGPDVYDAFPHQNPDLVREVVGVSHGNFERVRELVEASPALAKATWDWGFGDWESALGAASHTGNRDIGMFLIEHGARPTLFSATMLGQLEVVRAFVEASPGAQWTPGPHGIPLRTHAELGGEPAREVLAYLESLGDDEGRAARQTLTEAERQKYLGTYAFGMGASDHVEVYERRGSLFFRRGDQPGRGLSYLGQHEFHPAGANSVRIRFEIQDDRAAGVSVYDPGLLMQARRVAE